MTRLTKDDIDHLLEDAEQLEVNEEGEIVPRGTSKEKGIKLKDHVFY